MGVRCLYFRRSLFTFNALRSLSLKLLQESAIAFFKTAIALPTIKTTPIKRIF
ncbi:hypothetical protein [Planktothrix serta]|uniref:hypothetical protein n=1 Tax=Planktothrix serta TaxID=1678310 RepID=UPI0012DCD750|nr:hypothetical protein [Planktothrix serta]